MPTRSEPPEDPYKRVEAERDDHTNTILECRSSKIVVVGGPGTGKTTLFEKLIRKKGGKALTLSFINALVDELSLELYKLSKVKTLHGFSASFLKKPIFPKLPEVISEDASILLGERDVDFKKLFYEGQGETKHLEFYKERKDYYGNYYGYADIIYALVKDLEKKPHKIPQFSQIVVDEFQDFNKLEVSLIELLATKSPILLAGDDDQSLYIDLKGASPSFIREKYENAAHGFVSFPLPYCSRSTRVIVDSVNDILAAATNQGLLRGRITKPYRYFPSDKKDKASAQFPQLVYAQRYEGEMPNFIQKEIADFAIKVRRKFSVLIIVPPQLKNRLIPKFATALGKKGFSDITCPETTVDKKPTLLDGLKLLVKSKDDNLGWRIVSKELLPENHFESVLQASGVEASKEREFRKAFRTLIDKHYRSQVTELIQTLRKIKNRKTIEDDTLRRFMDLMKHRPYELAIDGLRKELLKDDSIGQTAERSIRKIPIILTTVPGSKGLAADCVFITHFDDEYFSQDACEVVNDKDVFSFLVALTRARKKACLISSKDKLPVLLQWINQSRIEKKLDSPHKKQAAYALQCKGA